MTKLEQIVHALAALTNALPGVYAVSAVQQADERCFIRLMTHTDEQFVGLAGAFAARISTVVYETREWDIGEAKLGEINLEVSGPHRDRHVLPEATPAAATPQSDAALAQAKEALS